MQEKKSRRLREDVTRPRTLSGSHVKAGKKAARCVSPVLELESARAPWRWRLQFSTSGKRLHVGLLIDRQYRLAAPRPLHIESNDRTHLRLKFRIGAVTPALDPMGLEVGLIEDASDLTRADWAKETLRYHRIAQALTRPAIARDLEILGKPARAAMIWWRSSAVISIRSPRTRTVL